mgnify:CR=1 FL=1
MYTQFNRFSKFSHVKKTEYGGGRFDSKFEASYAQELDIRQKTHDIKSWETHVRLELAPYGNKVCDYLIDFVITHNDGSREFTECKGFWTRDAKLKFKLFEALFDKDFKKHPDDKITLVMQASFKPMRFTRRADWVSSISSPRPTSHSLN